MLYPKNLPIVSVLEGFHRNKAEVKKKLKVFWIAFAILFFWEIMPEWIMPVLTGVSVFCLAKRNSLVFTNLFGGANGNEGLGILSICLDFQYITSDPMWLPLQSIVNNFAGYILCIAVFLGVYYMNIWRAQDFPFLSQLLFTADSNFTSYVEFNQSAILDANNKVSPTLLADQGLPYFATTYATYLLASNLAITATFTHMLLWNYDDLKSGWSFLTPSYLKSLGTLSNWKFWQTDDKDNESVDSADIDPHYKLMLAYKEAPNWWYGMLLALSVLVSLICIYKAESTLPWWSFLIAALLSAICILFFGAQYGITGLSFIIQPLIQMLGGYLNPGYPVANMYFTLYGYNSVTQGQLLLRDLKLGQYAHLAPRCTFTVQMVGTIVGAIFNYIMMNSIVDNRREVLLSIEGTNVWSGQNVQQYNSQAIAWGGLAKDLFSIGKRYEYVTIAYLLGFILPLPFYFLHRLLPRLKFDYWNTAIIAYYMGWLCVGINSSILSYFAFGFICQFYLRKYKPDVSSSTYLPFHPRAIKSVNTHVLIKSNSGSSSIITSSPPAWMAAHR
jgi:OPT family oligopeptide transporter